MSLSLLLKVTPRKQGSKYRMYNIELYQKVLFTCALYLVLY